MAGDMFKKHDQVSKKELKDLGSRAVIKHRATKKFDIPMTAALLT